MKNIIVSPEKIYDFFNDEPQINDAYICIASDDESDVSVYITSLGGNPEIQVIASSSVVLDEVLDAPDFLEEALEKVYEEFMPVDDCDSYSIPDDDFDYDWYGTNKSFYEKVDKEDDTRYQDVIEAAKDFLMVATDYDDHAVKDILSSFVGDVNDLLWNHYGVMMFDDEEFYEDAV